MAIARPPRHIHDVLCVVIPTLNPDQTLPALLAQVAGENLRIVVSDGGSTDDTLSHAISARAVVAIGGGGRGGQLARGAGLGGSDPAVSAYLFLHADSRLPDGWRAAVDVALEQPDTAWYFRFAPQGLSLSLRWLRFIVGLRCWAWRLPYGDQGLLIPRAMYDALGGYRSDYPLFEDVDMVERIVQTYGGSGLRLLPLGLDTDVSRHVREGVWTRGWRNYRLLRAYRRGTSVADLLKAYR